jgi:hypothetical protein
VSLHEEHVDYGEEKYETDEHEGERFTACTCDLAQFPGSRFTAPASAPVRASTNAVAADAIGSKWHMDKEKQRTAVVADLRTKRSRMDMSQAREDEGLVD